jgi:hypothetical protein
MEHIVAHETEMRRILGSWLSWWDLVPLLAIGLLAWQAMDAVESATPERVSAPVRATVKRNGETGEAVCRRYDVPPELCRDIEIDGNQASLLLDPDPVRPEVAPED